MLKLKSTLNMKLIILYFVLISSSKVKIKNGQFEFDRERIFLNGANQAWHWYGYDFGNGEFYKEPGQVYKSNVDSIATNGGNSIRFWLHCEGSGQSPEWDNNGYVIGTDRKNSLIDELGEFLDYAKSKNILVIICLWNGAMNSIPQETINIMWDESKLDSYINNALIPMAEAFKNHSALVAWEL